MWRSPGYIQGQHAISKSGRDIAFVNIVTQTETAGIFAIPALLPDYPALFLLLLFFLVFCTEGKDVAINSDRDILLFQPGKIRLQGIAIVGLMDIHRQHGLLGPGFREQPEAGQFIVKPAVEQGSSRYKRHVRILIQQLRHTSPPQWKVGARNQDSRDNSRLQIHLLDLHQTISRQGKIRDCAGSC
jgi:hypothetical protein